MFTYTSNREGRGIQSTKEIKPKFQLQLKPISNNKDRPTVTSKQTLKHKNYKNTYFVRTFKIRI